MAALSSVDYSVGALSSQTTGTVMTLNAVAAVAGTPAANALTVQPSSIAFSVAVSSITGGTITTIGSLSSGTVIVSSITGGTITTVGSLSSGTLASLSSGTVVISNAGTAAAVKGSGTAPSSTDNALVVALSPNGLNPNGTAVSSNSAPMTAASDQTVIGVALDTTRISVGTAGSSIAATPVFLNIGAASSGNTTLVSSATGGGKKIRVLTWDITANAAVDIQWQSGAPSSAVLAGPYHANSSGWGIERGFSPVGLFQTNSSEGLVINLSAASSVGGSLVYILV